MVKFLKEFNISDNTIKILDENFTPEEVEEANSLADRLYSSIVFLRNIGVSENIIESILIEDHHILLVGDKMLKKSVSKVNQEALVNALNQNVNYMYYLKDFM